MYKHPSKEKGFNKYMCLQEIKMNN